MRPNAISVAGTVFAGLGGICFYAAGRTSSGWNWAILLGLAASSMQLRLLCNLFDGMVAIEGGLRTKAGELFNELPDRFSDVFLMVGAGYTLPNDPWTHELGWAAAVMAVIIAYVRALGASMGAGQHFIGPMAKQQRMGLMTGASILAAFAPCRPELARVIPLALILIIIGGVITLFRRCLKIARAMEAR